MVITKKNIIIFTLILSLFYLIFWKKIIYNKINREIENYNSRIDKQNNRSFELAEKYYKMVNRFSASSFKGDTINKSYVYEQKDIPHLIKKIYGLAKKNNIVITSSFSGSSKKNKNFNINNFLILNLKCSFQQLYEFLYEFENGMLNIKIDRLEIKSDLLNGEIKVKITFFGIII